MNSKLDVLLRWLVATCIDHFIYGIVAYILFFTVPYFINIGINAFYIASYFVTMVYIVVYILKDSFSEGNSYGKRKMGLKIIKPQKDVLNFYEVCIRNISSLVLGIGSLFVFKKVFNIGNHFVKGDFKYFDYNPVAFFEEIWIPLLTIVVIDMVLVYFFSGRLGDLLGGTRIARKTNEE